MKKVFPTRIEELRGTKTQKEFAAFLGIPLNTYTNWTRGVTKPNSDAIVHVCTVLGVSADWLLGLTGSAVSCPRTSASGPHATSVPAAGSVPAVHGGACAACAVKDAQINKLLAIIDTLAKGGSASGSPSAHSETA